MSADEASFASPLRRISRRILMESLLAEDDSGPPPASERFLFSDIIWPKRAPNSVRIHF